MKIDMRYRGPDPKNTSAYIATIMLKALINDPSSRFQSALQKGMPKGCEPSNIQFFYMPSANASLFGISASLPVASGKKPVDLAFLFKELVRSTEFYMIKTNASYFPPTSYERARNSLLEAHMAIMQDPAQAANYMALLWSWGISFFFIPRDRYKSKNRPERNCPISRYLCA